MLRFNTINRIYQLSVPTIRLPCATLLQSQHDAYLHTRAVPVDHHPTVDNIHQPNHRVNNQPLGNEDNGDDIIDDDTDFDSEQSRLLHAHESAELAFQRRRDYKLHSYLIRQYVQSINGDILLSPILSQSIDSTLKQLNYGAGRGHEYKSTAYHLWHTAHQCAQQYSCIRRVLYELYKRNPVQSYNKILDYGSCTGAATYAIYDILQLQYIQQNLLHNNTIDAQHKFTDNVITSVESSKQLVDTHRRIIEPIADRLTINRRSNIFMDHNKTQRDTTTQTSNKSPTSTIKPTLQQHNLTICAYTLSRTDKDQREQLLSNLWNSTSETLVLIEHGDNEGFGIIAHARQYILTQYGKKHDSVTSRYATCIAPCTHDKPCPMLNKAMNKLNRICTFGERIIPSSLPMKSPARQLRMTGKGHVLVQNFSYVVFHRGPIKLPQVNVTPDNYEIDSVSLHMKPVNYTDPTTIDQVNIDHNVQSIDITAEQLAIESASQTTAGDISMRTAGMVYNEDGESEGQDPGPGQVQGNHTLSFSDVQHNAHESENIEHYDNNEIDDQNDDESTHHQHTKLSPHTQHLSPLINIPALYPPQFYQHSKYSRILTVPYKRGKHVILDLCNTQAQLERRIIPKSHGLHYGYDQAKFMKWGDIWQYMKKPSITDIKKQRAANAGELFVRKSKLKSKPNRESNVAIKPRGTGVEPQWLQQVQMNAAGGVQKLSKKQINQIERESELETKKQTQSYWNTIRNQSNTTDTIRSSAHIDTVTYHADTNTTHGDRSSHDILSKVNKRVRRQQKRHDNVTRAWLWDKTKLQQASLKDNQLTQQQVDILLTKSNLNSRKLSNNKKAVEQVVKKAHASQNFRLTQDFNNKSRK